MFYDALGRLMGQSGDVLAGRSGEGGSEGDGRDQRELRQIGVLLRRTSGIWHELFATLEAETRVLEKALEEANGSLRDAGAATIVIHEEGDPLGRYRAMERAIDEALRVLLASGDEDWAHTARRALRKQLAAAADVQGRLADAMLAIR